MEATLITINFENNSIQVTAKSEDNTVIVTNVLALNSPFKGQAISHPVVSTRFHKQLMRFCLEVADEIGTNQKKNLGL